LPPLIASLIKAPRLAPRPQRPAAWSAVARASRRVDALHTQLSSHVAAAVDASDVPNKGGVYVPKTASTALPRGSSTNLLATPVAPKTAPTAKAAPKAAPRGGGAQGGAQVTGADSSARHDAADERHGAQDDARRDTADERVQVDAVSLLAVREELKALAALWAYERRPLELKFRQLAPSMHALTTAPSPPHRYERRPLELKFRQTAAFAQRASLRVRWQGLPTDALDAAFGRPACKCSPRRPPLPTGTLAWAADRGARCGLWASRDRRAHETAAALVHHACA
jgi:hypothetical protein